MSLEGNLKQVMEKINQACDKVKRDSSEINIIAVTKYVEIEKTKEVLDLGLTHIGENRVKEGLDKYNVLHDRGIWHFIGNLQSRKVKDVVGRFEYIHSLDRLSIAKEINKRAEEKNIKQKCFVQVNVSGEETKSGVNPEELLDFMKQLSSFNYIRIVGLMTMAPFYEDKEKTRDVFKGLRELRDMVNHHSVFNYSLDELSMGMSNDFEIAIEEGATFLRLGTVLLK